MELFNLEYVSKLISKMDFEVALASWEVNTSECVELGAKYRMPIVVRNTFKPDDNQGH